jgi:hypothetical protein
VQLAFETRELRSTCENHSHAVQELGLAVGEALKHRLADLDAATSIRDVLLGNPRQLDGPRSHCMAIDLADDHVLIFCPNHTTNPVASDGQPDWPRVSRIRILGIEKNHA